MTISGYVWTQKSTPNYTHGWSNHDPLEAQAMNRSCGAFSCFSSKQRDLYDESFRDLVQAVLDGFNGTIFAYGQTGTGKTFTMQGTVA